ncbi:MAG: hypothetical protein JXR96_14135 [Deltaproteobacteria bacterium]|nr:hypothetical protein [Deltaproteobacteria bacterium]
MTARTRICSSLLCCLVPWMLHACGSGQDGNCPDVAGDWLITDHCEEAIEGQHAIIAQDGCSITVDWGGPEPWTGTVDENGGLSIGGSTGTDTLTCTGSLSGSTWSVDCAPGGCHVEAEKQ